MQDKVDDRPPLPQPATGDYKIRCIQVVDLGTQMYQNKPPGNKQVFYAYELIGTKAVFHKDKGEQPFVVSDMYNRFISDGSKLGKRLKEWLGAIPGKGEAFEHANLVNLRGVASVALKPGSKDPSKKRATVISMARVPKEEKGWAKAENPLVYFEIGAKDCKVLEKGKDTVEMDWTKCWNYLYPWIQKMIQLSPEYKEMAARDKFNPSTENGAATAVSAVTTDDGEEEESPF